MEDKEKKDSINKAFSSSPTNFVKGEDGNTDSTTNEQSDPDSAIKDSDKASISLVSEKVSIYNSNEAPSTSCLLKKVEENKDINKMKDIKDEKSDIKENMKEKDVKVEIKEINGMKDNISSKYDKKEVNCHKSAIDGECEKNENNNDNVMNNINFIKKDVINSVSNEINVADVSADDGGESKEVVPLIDIILNPEEKNRDNVPKKGNEGKKDGKEREEVEENGQNGKERDGGVTGVKISEKIATNYNSNDNSLSEAVTDNNVNNSGPGGFYKLFVGQVPYLYDEEMLRPFFSSFGKIVDIKIMREGVPGSNSCSGVFGSFSSSATSLSGSTVLGRSRGCAWVIYERKEDADAVIEAYHNKHAIPPQTNPLQVRYAAPSKTSLNRASASNTSNASMMNSAAFNFSRSVSPPLPPAQLPFQHSYSYFPIAPPALSHLPGQQFAPSYVMYPTTMVPPPPPPPPPPPFTLPPTPPMTTSPQHSSLTPLTLPLPLQHPLPHCTVCPPLPSSATAAPNTISSSSLSTNSPFVRPLKASLPNQQKTPSHNPHPNPPPPPLPQQVPRHDFFHPQPLLRPLYPHDHHRLQYFYPYHQQHQGQPSPQYPIACFIPSPAAAGSGSPYTPPSMPYATTPPSLPVASVPPGSIGLAPQYRPPQYYAEGSANSNSINANPSHYFIPRTLPPPPPSSTQFGQNSQQFLSIPPNPTPLAASDSRNSEQYFRANNDDGRSVVANEAAAAAFDSYCKSYYQQYYNSPAIDTNKNGQVPPPPIPPPTFSQALENLPQEGVVNCYPSQPPFGSSSVNYGYYYYNCVPYESPIGIGASALADSLINDKNRGSKDGMIDSITQHQHLHNHSYHHKQQAASSSSSNRIDIKIGNKNESKSKDAENKKIVDKKKSNVSSAENNGQNKLIFSDKINDDKKSEKKIRNI